MGKIRVLDEIVANQIAAGEVIERPSSVVKELVENAIDAGASTIDVTVEEGGLKLIRVVDNGSGMEADDCEAAFQRHATSKIASGKDLFRIRTLGFRGEALPSIAAVAKVECVTSVSNDGLGRKIVIEGGAVKSCSDATASRGTDISVRDLFYNTPARLKYMKTLQTELGHISDYVYKIALAYPDIAFTLRHNGNVLLRTLGNGDLLQVIAAVYGASAAKAMIALNAEDADYAMSGYVSRPELTRANRQGMTIVVNGRCIRNFALTHAILNAYHTLLPVNRFPLVVVRLDMAPQLIDVNVHPAKLEVRFSKENELTRFVEDRIRQALKGQTLIPRAEGAVRRADGGKPAVVQERMGLYGRANRTDAETDRLGSRTLADRPDATAAKEAAAGANGAPSAGDAGRQNSPPPSSDAFRTETAGQFGRPQRPFPDAVGPSPGQERRNAPAPARSGSWSVAFLPEEPHRPAPSAPFPKLYPIGQLHGTYIVAQNEDGLFLIDQHAAHERIHYEYYYEKFGQPQKASQQLLVPITLEFTPAEAERIRDRLALFEQVGVCLEHFGGGSFIVRSLPSWFPAGEEKAIIEQMAEWVLAEKKAIDLPKLREHAAILCSCKRSIKANEYLTMTEIESLIERLAACRNPYTCPHGRPVVVSFSTYELEKMFKRVM